MLPRFAADYSALYSCPPTDYILPSACVEKGGKVEVLLIGPEGSTYDGGLWRIAIVATEKELKATFKTRIWHPNVDERTGEIQLRSTVLADLLSVCFYDYSLWLVA